MESENLLIARIKNSNLADSDKEILIKILKDDTKNYDQFVKTLVDILRIGKVAFKFLDIDLE
ncbi:hypothetical protein [Zunongwangia atlantica]|uniref:Uncharacterized protein n=1 Tax=Zunongwangia atlantica 22II14-10F7 TaxID=1185767 RepID=A0A1Y1SXP7_9FLAO|nr:hypothetical protein [Zunongwangia atlantica]ORL43549.1 hypothetical protein IIF7_20261 [Zunongwangia atlantica 22II14-10F7]